MRLERELRVVVVLLTFVWLTLGLAICQTAESQAIDVPSTATIKIGILSPLTGSQPDFGIAEQNGILLAVAEWNEKGGVLGRQIETVIKDTQCGAGLSVPATNEMIMQEKISYIIGDLCSSSTIPASDIADDKSVILISPAATSPRVTLRENGRVKSNVFRICLTDPFQGIVVATLAREYLHKSSAYILSNTDFAYSMELARSFKKAFLAKGGTAIGEGTYRSKEVASAKVVDEIARLGPDIVYIPDYFDFVNDIANRPKSLPKVPILLGCDVWESPKLDLGAITEGYYVTHFSVEDNRTSSAEWMSRYYNKYNVPPNQIACLSYDSANVLLSAIEKAGSFDTSRIRKVLSEEQWSAITGPITFDSDHNPVKPAAVIKVKDGTTSFLSAIAP